MMHAEKQMKLSTKHRIRPIRQHLRGAITVSMPVLHALVS